MGQLPTGGKGKQGGRMRGRQQLQQCMFSVLRCILDICGREWFHQIVVSCWVWELSRWNHYHLLSWVGWGCRGTFWEMPFLPHVTCESKSSQRIWPTAAMIGVLGMCHGKPRLTATSCFKWKVWLGQHSLQQRYIWDYRRGPIGDMVGKWVRKVFSIKMACLRIPSLLLLTPMSLGFIVLAPVVGMVKCGSYLGVSVCGVYLGQSHVESRKEQQIFSDNKC